MCLSSDIREMYIKRLSCLPNMLQQRLAGIGSVIQQQASEPLDEKLYISTLPCLWPSATLAHWRTQAAAISDQASPRHSIFCRIWSLHGRRKFSAELQRFQRRPTWRSRCTGNCTSLSSRSVLVCAKVCNTPPSQYFR